jgi:predicted ABC-type ATPase
MGLIPVVSVIDRRPIIVALAGPNGAGKSSFYVLFLSRLGLHFVNADLLALMSGVDPYEAARLADTIRRQLVAQKASFVFETVFSDPVGDKLIFLKTAESAGYTVVLIFVGVTGPEVSDDRVAIRVLKGGHDVPTQKVKERFPRVMQNLKRALVELANIWVYDNSDLERKYRLVASKLDDQTVELHGKTPVWLRVLLP